MFVAQILIIAVVAVGLVLAYILTTKKFTISSKAFKILTAVLTVVFFVRYMWDRDLLMDIVALEGSQLDSVALTIVALIANWLYNSVMVLMLLHPFYNSSRSRIIVRYFGSAVLLLFVSTLRTNTIALYGTDVYSGFDIRCTLMAVELGILIALVAVEWTRHIASGAKFMQDSVLEGGSSNIVQCDASCVADSHEITTDVQYARPVTTSRSVEVVSILALIVGIIFANWPSYFLEAVVVGGIDVSIVYKAFSIQHIILYVCAFALLVCIYFVLRFRQKQTIKHILLYISLSVLVAFCNTVRFVDYIDVADWPIHICNLTIYLIPLCLIFHNRKLFAFVAGVSVPAAIIAMLFPNYDISSVWVSWALVRFWTNHYTPLILPVLMVMLGVYSKPTLRDVKCAIIALSIFFVIMVLANAYCLDATPDIDFFFLNGTQITSVMGIGFTRDILWDFSIGSFHFMIYPVYFVVFLATMFALCFVMCLLYRVLLHLDSDARQRHMARTISNSLDK